MTVVDYEYYYQIKGKIDKKFGDLSNWSFPPIFSGKVNAKSKIEAKMVIEKEYNKKFPLRVLTKDLDSNEFLLKITEIKDTDFFTKQIFEKQICKMCNKEFRRIDLYNDSNTKYKGILFCSDDCNDKYNLEHKSEIQKMFLESDKVVPVIYKITNKKSNKCYIGQTTQSFTLRWWQHIKWGVSDCKFHTKIRNSELTDWFFEVVEVVESINMLNKREEYYINYFDSINKGYNSISKKGVEGKQ